MPDGILGVVLAGGSSVRFGGDKAGALLDGQTLLARAIELAGTQVDHLVTSVAGSQAGVPGIESVEDRATGEGPLSGVLAGLERAEEMKLALLATFPCDVPFFPKDVVARLSRALSPADDYAIAVRGGWKHAVFALWRVACRSRLEQAFTKGLRSLHETDRILSCALATFEEAHDAPDGDPFFNVNTRDDLSRAAAYLQSRQGR